MIKKLVSVVKLVLSVLADGTSAEAETGTVLYVDVWHSVWNG